MKDHQLRLLTYLLSCEGQLLNADVIRACADVKSTGVRLAINNVQLRLVAPLTRNTLLEFLPRDAILSTVYAVVVCLSVCLCVCPSHSGIVSKRLNAGSHK